MKSNITLHKVNTSRPISYDIMVVNRLFSHRNTTLISGHKPNGKVAVFVDEAIYDSFFDEITSYYTHHNITPYLFKVNSLEANKTLANCELILTQLDSVGIDRRNEPVVAIGGGVVLDLVGLAASMYRRSVPVIKVATTLMAYVDAAIGIKNGVDFNGGKNRIGSFEPPKLVVLDRGFLETNPNRHIRNGVAEIFKLAIIKDYSLYLDLLHNGRDAILNKFQDPKFESILNTSIIDMITELEENLWETDLKRPSDFGHTFSPAIEMNALSNGIDLLHGECVSLCIAISLCISYSRDFITRGFFHQSLDLMKNLGIPTWHDSITLDILKSGLAERTIHRGGNQNTPLLKQTIKSGNIFNSPEFVNDIVDEELESAISYLKSNK